MNFIVSKELFHKKHPATGKKNYLSSSKIKYPFLIDIDTQENITTIYHWEGYRDCILHNVHFFFS
jgi:hypothetical protein